MKKVVGFPTKDGVNIEKHFGHSDKFFICVIENGVVEAQGITEKLEKAHGAAAKLLKDKDVNVVITGHMASTVFEAIKNNGVEIILGAEGNIEDAIKAYIQGTLICRGKEEYVHHYTDHSHGECCKAK
ncbi:MULTISPECIES: NifB/NifX family molybdenum-iron cluster-binding protein [Fusobacterium]|jgi:predicted Fe-Mo cluster-binding NifX family protein|uniref:NifB/NifX family molybdenum-iron cluster-binding protein n=1 Tax=Fusobacterium TaxID=848 RepID=UPI0015A049CA|nr:NifB/NifX family molybdenum-iron cluster-binding protein [Fusobacterium ulcerans]